MMIMLRQLSIACLLAVCLGCGGESFSMAPVSGTITLDGKPLVDARVGFEPKRSGKELAAGPGSYANTDQQGRFVLKSLDGRKGAVVGTHRVWIRTIKTKEGPNGEIETVVEEKVPARYNSQTELTFDVPGEGSEAADFALISQ